jgi:hypothetical protein
LGRPRVLPKREARHGAGALEIPDVATFGRYLVERGVLHRDQLEDATRVMVLFGGRLGTILVEAGALTLEQLEEHLSRHLRVPRAPLERIARPEPAALAAVPADLARRHRLLPLWIEKRRLHTAMLDPGNPDVVDELGFATGLSVSPHVVAERRLVALLERYYGIRPDPRFTDSRILELAGQLRESLATGRAQAPLAAPASDAEDAERAQWREAHGLAPLADGEELCGEEQFMASHTQATGSAPSAAAGGDAAVPTGKPASEAAPRTPARDAASVDRLEADLLRVSSRERVAPLVLTIAAAHARHSALFAVRDGMIQGVLAGGDGAPRRIDAIFVPVDAPSLLAGPARGEVFYGAPARTGIDAAILRALGWREVREVAAMPIAVAGRVVYLLYADNGAEPLEAASLAALGALCDQARATWSRLIVENTRRHC